MRHDSFRNPPALAVGRIKTCPICGDKTRKPIQAAFEHFWFWQPGSLQYLKGNIKTFGFWSGLHAWICLAFPFYSTLRHWKYRKCRLTIGGRDV